MPVVIAFAVAPLRSAWVPHANGGAGGSAHHHHHHHEPHALHGVTHALAHHHHHHHDHAGPGERDGGTHHCITDRCPGEPLLFWAAWRRAEPTVTPLPSAGAPAGLARVAALPGSRGTAAPRGPAPLHRDLVSIRTVVLRL